MQEHRRSAPDWSKRLLIVIATVSFVIGFRGFYLVSKPMTFADWLNVFFDTISLFSVSYDKLVFANEDAKNLLQVARIGAFVTTIWTVLKVLFPAGATPNPTLATTFQQRTRSDPRLWPGRASYRSGSLAEPARYPQSDRRSSRDHI